MWFNRFLPLFRIEIRILCSQLELNKNYLYSFGRKEIIDLFVCFALKQANKYFFNPFAQLFFDVRLQSTADLGEVHWVHLHPPRLQKPLS